MGIILRPRLPFQLLHPTKCYPDTLVLFLRGWELPSGIISELKPYCGTVFPEPCCNRYGFQGWKIVVHQPSRWGLCLLDKYQREHKGKISRLDIAVDLHPDQVFACWEWVLDRLVLKYRRRGPMFIECENTIGWVDHRGRKAPTRNIAVYCDEPSKITGRPCVHVEVKLTTARAIKRLGKLGIHRVQDVITINPAELLPGLIKLIEIEERERFGELPAQEIYNNPKNRKGLRKINSDVFGLPSSLSMNYREGLIPSAETVSKMNGLKTLAPYHWKTGPREVVDFD